MAESSLAAGTIAQIGIVVRDIEASAKAWAALLGQPVPDIVVTAGYERARTQYRGEPTPARARLAFFRLGQVTIELIEPLGGPSTWQEHLEAHGDSLHHIAFVVQGMQQTLAGLAAQGLSPVQRGEYPGGRYAYVDGGEKLGAILELLEND